MDTAKKNEQFDNEATRLVLEEFTQEQKFTNQFINDLIIAVNGLGKKLDEWKKEFGKPITTAPTIDLQPIQDSIRNGFANIHLKLSERRETVTKELPIIPWRWFLFFVTLFFMYNLCRWCMHYSDNQKQIQLEQVERDKVKMENDRTKKAWDYLYINNNKEVKRLMRNAYTKSAR